MEFTMSIDSIPSEITDYAFDQFSDRLREAPHDTLTMFFAEDSVQFDYEGQEATFTSLIETDVLRKAMVEKANDIQREIENGERSDYTVEEIRKARLHINKEF